MADFSVQVAQWCDGLEDLADAAFRAIAEAALARVKELTPVRTGNLRANWQVVHVDDQAEIVGRRIRVFGTVLGGVLTLRRMGLPGEMASGSAEGISRRVEGGTTEEALGVAGGSIAGSIAGAALGTAFLPVAGSVVGGWAGAAVGGELGGLAGRAISEPGQPEGTPGVPPTAGLGDKLIILNPVAYARAIEYGREINKQDGSVTRTQGRGMVEQTVAEMPELAERAVSRLLRGAR